MNDKIQPHSIDKNNDEESQNFMSDHCVIDPYFIPNNLINIGSKPTSGLITLKEFKKESRPKGINKIYKILFDEVLKEIDNSECPKEEILEQIIFMENNGFNCDYLRIRLG